MPLESFGDVCVIVSGDVAVLVELWGDVDGLASGGGGGEGDVEEQPWCEVEGDKEQGAHLASEGEVLVEVVGDVVVGVADGL